MAQYNFGWRRTIVLSLYKNLVTDKRHSFTEEKLEMDMIINFNNKYNFKNTLSCLENSLNFFYLVFK